MCCQPEEKFYNFIKLMVLFSLISSQTRGEMRMNLYRDIWHDKGWELKKKHKQGRAENTEPPWTVRPVRWTSAIRAELGLATWPHLSPLVLLSGSGGMTLPLPCIPWLAWSLFLFSLVTGLDLLTGNTIPCPYKPSSCVVLRQNIYAERSPNTASGGKSEILHQGSLMAWIDSEPH